jgi:hypothetical protein
VTDRFEIQATSPMFEGLDDVHMVFHGINKSGSLAMANVLREALTHAGREDDILSHYHFPGVMPLDEYRALVEAKRGRFFAVGHYLYGFLRPTPRRIWVTQFRHPLPRLVSAYSWLKNKHIKRNRTSEGFPRLTEFIRKGRGTSYSQVMQLGRGYGRFGDSAVRKKLPPRTLYELSVDAIDREFTAIAIAERFEESIFCFAALLGLPSVAPWAADSRNNGRRPVDELTQAQRDLIREVYHWDFELYDYALKRFAEQNARIKFGPSLGKYKAACSGEYKDRLIGASADDAMAKRFGAAESATRE